MKTKIITKEIALKIKEKVTENLFGVDWILDGKHNKESFLHGALTGIITQSIKTSCIPLLENRIINDEGYFYADIAVMNNLKQRVCIIECESSNSSDERIIKRDLSRYVTSILSKNKDLDVLNVETWLIISTLPNCQVENWPWHPSYNQNCASEQRRISIIKRNKNPLKFYEEYFHRSFNDAWVKILDSHKNVNGLELSWVNIDQTHIRIRNVNGENTVDRDGHSWRIFAD